VGGLVGDREEERLSPRRAAVDETDCLAADEVAAIDARPLLATSGADATVAN